MYKKCRTFYFFSGVSALRFNHSYSFFLLLTLLVALPLTSEADLLSPVCIKINFDCNRGE